MKKMSIEQRVEELVRLEENEFGSNVLKVGDVEVGLSDTMEPEELEKVLGQLRATCAKFGRKVRRAALRTVAISINQEAQRLKKEGISGIVRSDAVANVAKSIESQLIAVRKPAPSGPVAAEVVPADENGEEEEETEAQ